MDIQIIATSGSSTLEVTEDMAKELLDTYETLAELPSTRAAVVDFDTAADARQFAKIAKAFAEQNGIAYRRLGNVKDNPTRVEFRLYKPRPK